MRHFFWSNFFSRTNNEQEKIAEYWLKTPLFKGIPEAQLKHLVKNMHLRQFSSNETIFFQGDQGAGAILILQGSVKVMAKQVELATLVEGDFFGEIALAETDKRTADAIATTQTRLVFFLKQDLEEWVELEPQYGAIFLKNLAQTLALRLLKANNLLAQKK